MCSGSEAGSYLRLIDTCITELKAQGPSRTCNESNERKGGATNLGVRVRRSGGGRQGERDGEKEREIMISKEGERARERESMIHDKAKRRPCEKGVAGNEGDEAISARNNTHENGLCQEQYM